MKKTLQILILEDSDLDLQLLLIELRRGQFEIEYEWIQTAAQLEKALERKNWDVVLSDYGLPGFSGTAALKMVRELRPDTPFILVSGTINEEMAVSALKAGAHDFIVKGRYARLLPAIEREVKESEARQRWRELEKQQARLERQLSALQRLDALGKISSGVAHDFNNILQVIQAHATFLRKHISDNAAALPDLDAIVAASQSAQRLTGQLLAFGRGQAQQLDSINLNEVIGGVAQLLSRTMPTNIEFVISTSPDLGNIRADRSQIEQIIMNLVVNARDAMACGGQLTIGTADVTLDETRLNEQDLPLSPGRYVRLAVRDTGCGIAPEALPHIFDPFYTTKPEDKGTGLGLSTVFGIVKQSGGHISVESELGLGSTFNIYLPRIEHAKPIADNSSIILNSPSGSEFILVADDDDMVRNIVARILRGQNYQVADFTSAQEAIEFCQTYAGSIDLLISDIWMPNTNGRQLHKRLTEIRPELKTIFMSGNLSNDAHNTDLSDVHFAFIQKPFSITELLTCVRKVLDS